MREEQPTPKEPQPPADAKYQPYTRDFVQVSKRVAKVNEVDKQRTLAKRRRKRKQERQNKKR
jgi:hypothetical protein